MFRCSIESVGRLIAVQIHVLSDERFRDEASAAPPLFSHSVEAQDYAELFSHMQFVLHFSPINTHTILYFILFTGTVKSSVISCVS